MTPTMDATTRRLVDFALAYRFEDLPASTVHAPTARLLDSAAVGLPAYAAPLAHALSLSVVPHLCTYQTRSGELSMWKGCAGPNGARHGVFAAQLAREGLTGPYSAYEGIFGIWKQTLGKPGEFKLPAGRLAAPLGLNQTNIKKHPVCATAASKRASRATRQWSRNARSRWPTLKKGRPTRS